MIRLVFWGVFLATTGGALCGFSKEDGLIPVNKNLWTTSFIFVQGQRSDHTKKSFCFPNFYYSVYKHMPRLV